MWFYRQVIAHHAAKNPLRREAYLLGKLDSLWSWRGRLVDNVITRQVVPALAAGRDLDLSTLLAIARENYDAQLTFAEAHHLREAGMRPSQHPDFTALLQSACQKPGPQRSAGQAAGVLPSTQASYLGRTVADKLPRGSVLC